MVSWENSPARPLWGLFTTATITEQTTTAWLSSEVGRTKTVGNIAQALADLPPAARAVLAGTPRNPTTRSNPFSGSQRWVSRPYFSNSWCRYSNSPVSDSSKFIDDGVNA